ncbi:MAG: hypothetical protein C0183_04030 [Roseiflexus castenholzii]|nr:MAG: hypothetical protein C0183_04030 [Roseiflexus castenholzii]
MHQSRGVSGKDLILASGSPLRMGGAGGSESLNLRRTHGRRVVQVVDAAKALIPVDRVLPGAESIAAQVDSLVEAVGEVLLRQDGASLKAFR